MTTQNLFDPIFALATAPVRSALHVHRVSGQGIFKAIAPYLLNPKTKKNIDVNEFPSVKYGLIIDKQDQVIDDCMLSFFKGPASFTGQDTLEISTHGNLIVSQRLHSFLRSLGFRDALPGEFTQRAVMMGKLDLSQAEAIHDLICAETSAACDLARNNLSGVLSGAVEDLKREYIKVLSYLEAHIDFAPDEVGDFDGSSLAPVLLGIKERLIKLNQSYDDGQKFKQGVKLALCGKPNVGKSTLFNTLLKTDAAIVTDVPGTTRDVLTERLFIFGKEFVLHDTAGIRKTNDTVEKIGIARTQKTIENCDVLVWMINASLSPNEIKIELEHIPDVPNETKIVIAFTKCDLISQAQIFEIKNIFYNQNLSMLKLCFISQDDTQELKNILVHFYDEILKNTKVLNNPTLISKRQKDKIILSLSSIDETLLLINQNDVPEKMAHCVMTALRTTSEILGEVNLDDIYDSIFSTFCIGK